MEKGERDGSHNSSIAAFFLLNYSLDGPVPICSATCQVNGTIPIARDPWSLPIHGFSYIDTYSSIL